MQNAYKDYRHASEALDSADRLMDESPDGERSTLSMIETRQRATFERYLEARMEYLESRFDDWTRPGGMPPEDPEDDSHRFVTHRKPLVAILAIALLGTTAFSAVRARRQIRNLEASRDELRASLKQTRDVLQVLANRVDTWQAPQPVSVHQVSLPTARPARSRTVAPKAAVRKATDRRQPAAHAPQKNVAGARTYQDRRHARRPS
jgi:hypothetical protein